MSTSARIQFIRVDPTESARMASWTHHLSRLTGTPLAIAPDQSVFLWQLTAANHRILGRCAISFRSIAEAREDVASVVEARASLTVRMVRLEASRSYGWALLDRGDPVLTCARWYTMERDRRESLRMTRLGLDLLSVASEQETELPVAMAEGRS
jgi:hypothetical protein